MSLTRVKNITDKTTVRSTLTVDNSGTNYYAADYNEISDNVAFRISQNRNSQPVALAMGSVGSSVYTGIQSYDNTALTAKDLVLQPLGGYVTKPNNPAFYARHTTATTYNSAYLQNFTVTYDTGGNFNSTTGTFTAPVSGVYQLNAMLGNNYANGNGNYMVKVNGNDYNGFVWDPYTGQSSWSTSILVGQLKLTTNDSVRIYCNSAGHPDNANWTSWSMALIG